MIPLLSKGQLDCSHSAIVAAEENYRIEKLSECINELKPCIEGNGFTYYDKALALKLCAMSYIAMDSQDNARRYIEKLLNTYDNFTADASDPEEFRVVLDNVRHRLKEMQTSSVSKKTGNIDLAPATVQIITAKDIQNRGYSDIESIFSDLPGFDVSRTFGRGYSTLYARGSRTSGLTEKIMILVDGVEDNDLFTNSAIITKQYPISSIKRIEIIYGPASTIYGANAFSGVVNIVTKDDDDHFPSTIKRRGTSAPKNIAVNLHTGSGSRNTKFTDGTISTRSRNTTFTVTGRHYISDGVDLSSDPSWDGNPVYNSALFSQRMTMKYTPDSAKKYVGPLFQVNADSTKIVPTAAGIAHADSLDRAAYKTNLKDAGIFKNPINDAYVSARLTIDKFKLGMQYWNKREGVVGDYVDNYLTVNAQYASWQIRDYFIYAGYDKRLSSKFTISSLTYYRFSDLGTGSRLSAFRSYELGIFTPDQFLKGTGNPFFTTINFYEASDQIRSELKGQLRITDKIDVLTGAAFTSAQIQNNYITSSKSPALTSGTAIDSPGGNKITNFTTSVFSTLSYTNPTYKFNADIGGRLDNNIFRQQYGYGTVFNPRIDIIYYPARWVFKAIYAEAFLDASNSSKFSTSSSQRLSNPGIKPEKLKNIELSTRYKITTLGYLEVSAYRSNYTNATGLDTARYSGGITTQFKNIGGSLVHGVQIATEITVNKHVACFGNLTYCDPKSIFTKFRGGDSIVRTGDIATLSGNAGINILFFRNKVNLNTRVNVVGDKQTGKGTSVTTNPYNLSAGYTLLNETIGYHLTKSFLLQAGCNNILNTAYYSPGTRSADGIIFSARVPQALRNYVFKLIVDL